MAKRVGVLALQGDFEAHSKSLLHAGAVPVEVRTAEQLKDIDGLIIPGGESTTMLRLMNVLEFTGPLREFGAQKPIFGTCAGAILLARSVLNPVQDSLDLMDLTIQRNAYGRQIHSRIAVLEPGNSFQERAGAGKLEAVFIRAPIIRAVGTPVTVLAEYEGDPVLVEQGMHLAATFHPELTKDSRVHSLFLSKL